MDQRQITGIDADGQLFPIDKLEAHRSGMRHVAISVFVFSGASVLLQRRARGKYHSAGQWANACCSHPDWGEAVIDCAHRRLEEEMGLLLELRSAGIMGYRADVGGGLVENEHVHLFFAECDAKRMTLRPDPNEVSDYRWLDSAALRREIAESPHAFTPWLRIYMARGAETGIAQLAPE
ncbi:isopentenyl-diphosphate Delta-isomerase [Halomonas sp. HP20-15]|uniref:isopentenyl-diphosphate Delta-isomerase n=1 Tax=Halomonas sp. HP20-15 TaxID=3085901 RepID=UPI002982AB9D|nr:isopentenyl-diphosphate Delta-isomerase [Halomonas sp. HP20-15]MDW5376769.1 isopentenyl-diphosphate Delta-isomerase [Halomonas sp. HP20-15]